MKLPTVPAPKPPRPQKVKTSWPTEVEQQQRRITGVTPRLTRSFSEKPWMYFKRSTGLQGMARAQKTKGGASGV